MEKQECCQEKNVGNVSYTLLADQYLGKLPDHCLNDCVYTIINSSSPKFCFARGLISWNKYKFSGFAHISLLTKKYKRAF